MACMQSTAVNLGLYAVPIVPQALKQKVAALVAAVNKRNIMKATQQGNYQNELSGSLRRFLHYLHVMRHVCFDKSIADPVAAAAEAAKAKAAFKAKVAAAQAAAEASGQEVEVVEEYEEKEARFTLQEVRLCIA